MPEENPYQKKSKEYRRIIAEQEEKLTPEQKAARDEGSLNVLAGCYVFLAALIIGAVQYFNSEKLSPEQKTFENGMKIAGLFGIGVFIYLGVKMILHPENFVSAEKPKTATNNVSIEGPEQRSASDGRRS